MEHTQNDTRRESEPNERQIVAGDELIEDELYIFSRSNPPMPDGESLWGVFKQMRGSTVRLESCSSDLKEFRFWTDLPSEYRFCRRATAVEAREYGWGCCQFEIGKE